MKTYKFDVTLLYTEERNIPATITSDTAIHAYDQVKALFPEFKVIKILEVA